MNGKEAYDKIFDKLTYDQQQELGEEVFRIVYQDLDKFEKLVKENQELREKVNHFKNVKNRTRRNYKFVEKENIKLKKVIEIIIGYLIMYNDVSFETFMTSQCDDEEQEICREVFKEVWENA